MNKIYRIIWNKNKSCWQAVSELAKNAAGASCATVKKNKASSKIYSNYLSLLVLPALSLLSFSVSAAISDIALPTGQQVIAGSAEFKQSGNTLNVLQQSQNLSASWNTFNIGSQAEVNFVQPNNSSIAVNRVLDSNGSQIMGRLNANGQVFLINPNGVLFSKTAQVNAGGIVASTLDLQDQDLFQGKFSFSGNGKAASVENHGKITAAHGGTVALIASDVKNTGEITVPNGRVELTAAEKVRITLQNGKLASYDIDQGALQALVDNGGAIIADNGTVHLTVAAEKQLGRAVVNHSGYIQANRLETNAKGEIVLLGDMSNGQSNISGTLAAEGKNGQNGGFIETSAAAVHVSDAAKVSTEAEHGAKQGQWLIDPVDFKVGQNGHITGAALSAALKTTDVIVQTGLTQASASGAVNTDTSGKGDIIIEDAVAWDSGKALTLDAYNDIYINHVIDAGKGAGGQLHLKYGQQSADGSISEIFDADEQMMKPIYADYYIQAPVHLQQGLNFSIQRGSDVQNFKAFHVLTDIHAVQNMQDDLSGNYALGSNIDAAALANFSPVGTLIEGTGPNSGNRSFTGRFDGLGHIIENLTVHAVQRGQGQGSNWGMFGKTLDADIRNIGLMNVNVSGDDNIGGLAGSISSTHISNSFVTGKVAAQNYAGGLVGSSYFSSIERAYADVNVQADNMSGALAGEVYSTVIKEAYALNADGSQQVWDSSGAIAAFMAGQEKNSAAYSVLGWSVADRAGMNGAWRIYEGQTAPLLKAFLTPLTVKADDYSGTYNGQMQNSSSYTVLDDWADASKILGSAVYTGGIKNAGLGHSQLAGLYSVQNGYDLIFSQGDITLSKAQIYQISNAVADKIYDGLLTAQVNANAVAAGLFGADQVSVSIGSAQFSDKNAGSSKTVSLYNVTLNGADAQNYELASNLTSAAFIFQKVIDSISGIEVLSKTYDGTVNASLNAADAMLFGKVENDSISLTGSASFIDKNAGSAKSAQVSNLQLSGADAGNYALSSTLLQNGLTAAADIHQAEIRIDSGLKALNKTYDGTVNALLDASSAVLSGKVQGDELSASGTASFTDKNAGEGKTVYIGSLNLTGADASNYKLEGHSSVLSADIEKADLTVSQLLAKDKVYDGTDAAEAELWRAQLNGKIASDFVALSGGKAIFSDKNAGQNKTVYISDLVLTGADAQNYQLQNTPYTASANITQKVISDNSGFGTIIKTYDGKLSAPLYSQYAMSADMIQGDNVILYAEGASFGSKDAGAKIAKLEGLQIHGADAANYQLSANAPWLNGVIEKAVIQGISGLQAQDKVYDGTVNAVIGQNSAVLNGVVFGDSVSLNIGSSAFAVKDAGADRQVILSDLALIGADAKNYQLYAQNLFLTANIQQAEISSISGLKAADKVYDGTVKAGFDTRGLSFDGQISGDDLGILVNGAFEDKNAGTGKKVSLDSLVLIGKDALNYKLKDTALAGFEGTANISKALITEVQGLSAQSKTYDGIAYADINTGMSVLKGKVGLDDLHINAQGQFEDKNAGENKNVWLSLQLAGKDASNYELINPSLNLQADIYSRIISSISGVIVADKITTSDDGTFYASINTQNAVLGGKIGGDQLVLNAKGRFEDNKPGNQKPVHLYDAVLTGPDASNYSLGDLKFTAQGNIKLPAAGGGSFAGGSSSAAGIGAIGNSISLTGSSYAGINLQGLDIETALLEVQSRRAELLENQLAAQINAVQATNDQIAKLNDVLAASNGLLALFKKDETHLMLGPNIVNSPEYKKWLEAAAKAGVSVTALIADNKISKSVLSASINNTKSQIDSLSNSQQMDMLRLQSLSNKRNEAFEQMTNFVKKLQDSRSSIIGNMR
jgi:filamentous hemagglutinin family protein